MTLRSRLIQ